MAPVAAFDPTRRATPTAHLTPDDETILVEHYDWRATASEATAAGAAVRFKTGRLDLYEAANGALLRTIELDSAPGARARLAGFSPDSSIALIGARERIHVVDLRGEAPSWSAAGAGLDGFWLQGVVFFQR